MNISSEKKLLRSKLRTMRNDLDMTGYRESCNTIHAKILSLPEWRRAGRVHIYVSSLGNEVDTLGLLYKLFDEGRTVVVPKCVPGSRQMRHVRILSLDDLKPGQFGIMEPEFDQSREMPPSSLDLVIAPLVGYDRAGRRLGMGGGFYDSFIKECRCPVCGLAYSFQELETVPVEEHDACLDIIVNEKEIIRVSHD